MVKIIIPVKADLDRGIRKTYLDMLFATDDNDAHQVDVQLFRGQTKVSLSGAAVTAYFIRYSDNATISLTGEASGDIVSVTMKKSCYNKPGQFALIIKATVNGVTNTVFYGEGTIFVSSTDTILDEENVIPSLDDLLAQIATMETATNAANTAAGNANTATSKANTATTNANNAAAKIDGMTVSAAKADEAGAVISEVNGVKHIAFKLPKGDKGDKGDPGTIENVTITSINGLPEALNAKLPTDGTAANASKLGGYSLDEIMLKLYPVGAIYTSTVGTSPASLFGGTWEQLKDRFLLGAGDSYAAGSTGGEAEVVLDENNLPERTCVLDAAESTENWNAGVWRNTNPANAGDSFVNYAERSSYGAGVAHNNMPPYLTVYMWKRVS